MTAKGTFKRPQNAILGTTALVWTLFCASPLFAGDKNDVIVMRNGDRITCEIKQLRAGVLSVKLSYVEGAVGIQWSQVYRIESGKMFVAQTSAGAVYTGKLSTPAMHGEPAAAIQAASAPEREAVSQGQIVKMDPASASFWSRFEGAVDAGILYAKGNESTQYNLAAQLAYRRDRWYGKTNFNSSLASSSGASLSVRTQTDFSGVRLLRWNNWFYEGTGSFLQSSVQGIDLQATLGGGLGRYLKNSNRASLRMLGGFAWRNTQYRTYIANQSAQNTAAALVAGELNVFKFKRTNLDVSTFVFPELSEPGRLRVDSNASYCVKVLGDLSWNVSFYGNWDNRPPSTLQGSDYGTSLGLGWTFGDR